LFRGPLDRLYLSGSGTFFVGLVVNEEVHLNGVNSGLGPYANQPGVPPPSVNVPIESNYVPEPAVPPPFP
jgi:hypothetical protein